MNSISEWACPGHTGFPKTKADRLWIHLGGLRPFPKSPLEWLERQGELAEVSEIMVKPRDKYWDVVSHIVGPANDNLPEPANDNRRGYAEDWELEDDVPF